ncbi:MAG: hypothetical protein M3394_01825 [Actinomycetota bacterium]|nr:hypothetical protein [Actinomycetota bacterium]
MLLPLIALAVVAEPAAADPVAGPGYNLFDAYGLLPSGYTVRLVLSDGIEEWRDEINHVASQLNALGIPVSLAPGTTFDRPPRDGEIIFEAGWGADCEPGPAGCARMDIGLGPDPNKTYITGGDVDIFDFVADYSPENRRHVVAHELGHVLGLDHYSSTYNGVLQAMHESNYSAAGNFQQGDINGLAWERDYGKYTPTAQWHPWTNLGGSIVGSPDVASWDTGRLDVFARDSSNRLVHRYFNGAWSNWLVRGGTIASDPAAVSWGPNRIDVFARDANNTLVHTWFDGAWHAWESLGGTILSAPTAASWGPGRLDVFAVGLGNRLVHKYFNGAWSGWLDRGGVLKAERPGAVSWGSGRIDVVARGLDDSIQHLWYQNGWAPWGPLGGRIYSGGPEVSSWGPGRLDVFAAGPDYDLLHRWYQTNTGWSAIDQHQAAIEGSPGAVSWGPGRIDVFAKGNYDTSVEQYWFGV